MVALKMLLVRASSVLPFPFLRFSLNWRILLALIRQMSLSLNGLLMPSLDLGVLLFDLCFFLCPGSKNIVQSIVYGSAVGPSVTTRLTPFQKASSVVSAEM